MTITKKNFLLYSGAFLLIIKTLISSSKILLIHNNFDNFITILGLLLLFLSFFTEKFTVKEILVYGMILSFTAYNALLTHNNALVITVVMCLAVRNSDLKHFVRYVLIIETIYFVLHTMLAIFLSLTFNVNITQTIGGVIRWDFGMLHPNSFAAIAFNLFIMVVWCYWDKINKINILFVIPIVILIYVFCKTRTSLLIMVAIIMIIFIYKVDNKYKTIIKKISKYIVPILTVFMAVLIMLYLKGNNVSIILNKLLNARISLGAYAYEKAGFTFVGQNLEWLYTGTVWDPIWKLNAFTFDSIYTYMMINQGFIWLLIISYLFYKIANRNVVRDNIVIIAWALYSITEVQGLNCFSCMPILLVSYLLSNNYKKNIKSETVPFYLVQ